MSSSSSYSYSYSSSSGASSRQGYEDRLNNVLSRHPNLDRDKLMSLEWMKTRPFGDEWSSVERRHEWPESQGTTVTTKKIGNTTITTTTTTTSDLGPRERWAQTVVERGPDSVQYLYDYAFGLKEPTFRAFADDLAREFKFENNSYRSSYSRQEYEKHLNNVLARHPNLDQDKLMSLEWMKEKPRVQETKVNNTIMTCDMSVPREQWSKLIVERGPDSVQHLYDFAFGLNDPTFRSFADDLASEFKFDNNSYRSSYSRQEYEQHLNNVFSRHPNLDSNKMMSWEWMNTKPIVEWEKVGDPLYRSRLQPEAQRTQYFSKTIVDSGPDSIRHLHDFACGHDDPTFRALADDLAREFKFNM